MPNLDSSLAALLDFSGQTVVITGANRGLGKAMASRFWQAGANVALLARNQSDLDAVVAELRGQRPAADAIYSASVDVANTDQVNQAAQEILAKWGRVDVLVNNAGLVSPGSYDKIDLDEWDRILNANLTGAFRLVRAFAPAMQQQRSGRIINISSITAQTGGVSGGVHYSASKGGMLAMTKTLARDLAPYNITVNSITPGQIDSRGDMMSAEARQRIEAMIPLGRLGHVDDIAYAALFLASPMAAYITGTTLDVNGGLLKR
jgi:NAD(P)-dependent dehydrogenase (short-subunit alcohol dehydrogenase family)